MGYILLLSYMDGAFQQALEGISFFEYCQTLSNIASMSGTDASDIDILTHSTNAFIQAAYKNVCGIPWRTFHL